MQKLSNYQRRILLQNPNIEKITEHHVIFTSKFKIKAVESYLGGLTPNQIFEQANININYFNLRYAESCIKKWKKKYNDQGKESFHIEKRGSSSIGRPKKENLDELTYEELQIIVEIQRSVIDELKKKKALAKKK